MEISSEYHTFLFMMTSSNGNIFHITGFCAGNSPVTGEFTAQRPVTRSFDVFFDLRLNKQLSEQSWGWWFETPSGSLWRHSNVQFCTWWSSCWIISCANMIWNLYILFHLHCMTWTQISYCLVCQWYSIFYSTVHTTICCAMPLWDSNLSLNYP